MADGPTNEADVIAAIGDFQDPETGRGIAKMEQLRDIKINGNADQTFTGLIAAHEQFQISGNPRIEGAIIAEGAASTDDRVAMNEIAGSLQLCYDGGLTFPDLSGGGTGVASMVSWQDMEIARGTGVFATRTEANGY